MRGNLLQLSAQPLMKRSECNYNETACGEYEAHLKKKYNTLLLSSLRKTRSLLLHAI